MFIFWQCDNKLPSDVDRCVSQAFFHGETHNITFNIYSSPSYENVYVSQKVDSVECNSFSDNLLWRKFIYLKLLFKYIDQLILQEKQQRIFLVFEGYFEFIGAFKLFKICVYLFQDFLRNSKGSCAEIYLRNNGLQKRMNKHITHTHTHTHTQTHIRKGRCK